MPNLTPYKLFQALLWNAEQSLRDGDLQAVKVAAALLAEVAQYDFVMRKLNQDDRLRHRWDVVFAATDEDYQPDPPIAPAALAESLIQAAEFFLEGEDHWSVVNLLPRLAYLEGVHGVDRAFPGDLAERVDAVRMAMKDAPSA
jgi:hypothetical protein